MEDLDGASVIFEVKVLRERGLFLVHEKLGEIPWGHFTSENLKPTGSFLLN